jgi:hypothetical protein
MNTIITHRTNPNVRFKIQGVILCEKLNKHLEWKKHMDAVFRHRLEQEDDDEHEYVIEE